MERKDCRICGSKKLELYLDLGSTPLANSYLKAGEPVGDEPSYPLAVNYCHDCHNSQLTVVVPPQLMFENYLYVSSTPKTFRDHCGALVQAVKAQLPSWREGDLALDIASNDGCLLSYFKGAGFRVLGVDPAKNLAKEANAKGIETVCDYWGRSGLAAELVAKHGRAKTITAQNVFAHVDGVHDFLAGASSMLDPEGLLVIEAPYMGDLLDHCEFDTIYHEHLSYFLLHPVKTAMEKHGLRVTDVSHQPVHGGTMRVTAAHAGAKFATKPAVAEWLAKEKAAGFHGPELYRSFGKRVNGIQRDLRELLTKLRAEGKKVYGYGASAKGNTLLNSSRIGTELLQRIVDDNPKKWGYVTPGAHIPIDDPARIASDKPDYLVLLAWNFGTEIKARTKDYGAAGGKYIAPVPEVRIS